MFTAESLRQGILPLSIPIFSGLPWLADINQSVLFPPYFLFGSTSARTECESDFHWAIAFGGAYLLGKQWTGRKKSSLWQGSLWHISHPCLVA